MKLSALAVLLSATLYAQTKPAMLPQDTQVPLKLMQTLSSAEEKTGDLVGFAVVDDVKVGDTVVIPHGAPVTGHVTEAQPRKWAGRGGKLNVVVDYVRLSDGRKIALAAEKRGTARGHTAAMTVGMVATGIVFFPAAPLFLFVHGKEMVIPQGTVVNAFVASDVPVTP